MIAADLALALDPVRVLDALEIVPDAWQREALRSCAPRALWNCARQSGKSTIAAAIAVHTALLQGPALVLVLSPSLRQSGELFKKCMAIYAALGRPVPPASETALTLTLENGSRIVSLPGKEGTIRGYSGVALLIIDEAARVPDDLLSALRPMLAVSGGRLLALSTPFGRRGWWAREWLEGGPGWERVEVPAAACPRIPPAFLAEERRSLGRRSFSEEYQCAFADAEDAVFTSEDIAAAASAEIRPLAGSSRFFTAFDPSVQELDHVVFGPRSRAEY